MKLRSYIWLLGAVTIGFAACDDDDEFTGIPQVNPQAEVLATDAVTASNVYAANATVNVNAAAADLSAVMPMLNITNAKPQPDGYEVKVHMLLAKTAADLANPAARYETILSEAANGSLGITAEELNVAFHGFYGPSHATQPLAVRFDAYSVNAGAQALLGTVGTTATVNVAPVQYAYDPENSYYLVNAENADERYQMFNSGASVWDDPNFSVVVTVNGSLDWRVVPASIIGSIDNSKCFGPADASVEAAGDLVLGASGRITGSGPYMVSVNVTNPNSDYTALQPTFETKQAYSNFWIAGTNINGVAWGFAADPNLWTNDYTTYVGFAHIEAASYDATAFEFKFSPQAGWGGDFGCSQQLTWTGNVGTSKADGGDNIKVPGEGLYYIELNYTTKDLKVTKIETLGLIGGFNGWGSSVAMTAIDNYTYAVTLDMNEGDEWKIRANDGWDISLGGDVNNLTPFNGSNIRCSATGTYEVTLHLSPLPWSVDVVKK